MSGDANGSAAEREGDGDAGAATGAAGEVGPEGDGDSDGNGGVDGEAEGDGNRNAERDVDGDETTSTERTTDPDDGAAGPGSTEGTRTRPSPSAVVAAGLLATIPVVLLALPVAGLLRVTGTTVAGLGTVPVALLTGLVVGLGGSYAVGPVLVRRSVSDLADVEGVEAIEELVAERATVHDLEPPRVRFVDVDAATIAVVDSLSETTLVVPTRIEELDPDAREAAIEHALCRIETRNAALVTALLAPALLVEAWTLLGLELARRREDPEEDDRLPQMLGAGDREERGVPWVVFVAVGVLLLVAVAPLWVVFAVGDRLLVGGARRRADDLIQDGNEVGGADRPDGPGPLADALTFARDARGARDWPPTLDRLSLLGMADPVTQRVRGTSRMELRVRLARLRARENREQPDERP